MAVCVRGAVQQYAPRNHVFLAWSRSVRSLLSFGLLVFLSLQNILSPLSRCTAIRLSNSNPTATVHPRSGHPLCCTVGTRDYDEDSPDVYVIPLPFTLTKVLKDKNCRCQIIHLCRVVVAIIIVALLLIVPSFIHLWLSVYPRFCALQVPSWKGVQGSHSRYHSDDQKRR